MSWYSEAAKVPSFMLAHECNHHYIEKPAIALYQRRAVFPSVIDQFMKEDHMVRLPYDNGD